MENTSSPLPNALPHVSAPHEIVPKQKGGWDFGEVSKLEKIVMPTVTNSPVS